MPTVSATDTTVFREAQYCDKTMRDYNPGDTVSVIVYSAREGQSGVVQELQPNLGSEEYQVCVVDFGSAAEPAREHFLAKELKPARLRSA